MLQDEYSQERCDKLWADMRDVVALSVLSSEKIHGQAVASMVRQRLVINIIKFGVILTMDRSHSFEILGYDILIDNNLKPWLLEINHTPSLEPLTELENGIKRNMIRDLFDLVDITDQRRLLVNAETNRIWELLQSIQLEFNTNQIPDCVLYNSALAKFNLRTFTKQLVWVLVCLELDVSRIFR